MPRSLFFRPTAKSLQRSRLRAFGALPVGICGVMTVFVLVTDLAVAQGKVVAQAGPAASTPVAAKAVHSKPLWRDLNARQQKALQPLAARWDGLSELHKKKWLALSRNYANLSPQEQEVMHSRMTEWSSLSQQERVQARLNFAEVKKVPVDERKAKWEAYQALSEEEKRKLASRATPPRQPGAAATIQPVPIRKFAPLPALGPDALHMPRIQIAPPGSMPASLQVATPAHAPVSAEEQVPEPAATPVPAELPRASIPPVRVTDQPSSAP